MFLLSQIDAAQLARITSEVRLDWVFLAFLFFLAGQLIHVARWQVILSASGFGVPFVRLLAVNLVGMFFSNFLPSSVGGDFFKAIYIADARSYGRVMTATILTRYIGMMSTLILGLMAMPFAADALRSQSWWPLCAALMAAASLAGVVLLMPGVERRAVALLRWLRFPERLVGILDSLVEPLRAWRSEARTITWTAGLSVAFLIIGFTLVAYFCALSVNEDLPIPSIIVIAAISSVAIALPISVNGLGVAEGAWVYLFSLLGVAPEKGLLIALLFRGLMATQGILGGVVYLFLRRKKVIPAE